MSKFAIAGADLFNGLHYFKNQVVVIQDGKIDDVISEQEFKPNGIKTYDFGQDYVISPGFIDSHIHGMGGYGTDDIKRESIVGMSEELTRFGVTSFCPTVYPNRRDLILDAVKCIKEGRDIVERDKKSSNIIGVHLEGPFISKSKKGAQKEEYIIPVDVNLIDECYKISEGNISNITVAAELKNLEQLVKYAREKNIILQMGHSDSNYEQVIKAIKLGIKHCTHFFNAMSPLEHRNPNLVGTLLGIPSISIEVICDKKHFHPIFFNMLKRTRDIEKLIMISDALTPTGQSKCPFYANGDEVELKEGLFIIKKNGTIAGSSLTLNVGVKNLVEEGYTIAEALSTASTNPAKLLNLTNKGFVAIGYDADITVLNKKDFSVALCIVNGNVVRA